MPARRIKKHYHTPFATWVRRQLNHNKLESLRIKFDVPQSLLFKYANGTTQPSIKHFNLYQEFLKQTGDENDGK